MATKLAGPLAMAATPDEAAEYNMTMKDLMGQLAQSPEDSKKDEMLAWTGGLGTGTDGSGTAGALGRAAKAQSEQRLAERQMKSQYIPLIMNAVAAQRASSIQQRLLGTLGNKPIAEMSLEEVNLLENAGGQKGLMEKWKTAKQGLELKQGWNVAANGRRFFVPDISKGLGYDEEGNVMELPNFGATQAAITGQAERAKLDAQTDYEMVDAVAPDGTPIKVAKRKALQAAGAPPAVSGATPAPSSVPGAPGMPGTGTGGTLGMRNNNPGNMRPVGADTGFQKFNTMQEGLAALDNDLQIKGARGVNTIRKVISAWAPPPQKPGDDQNNTEAYIATVAKRLGVPPDAQLDMGNPLVRQALSTAISLHENGPKALLAQSRAPEGGGAGGGLPTGRSPLQKTADENIGKGNDLWLSGSYSPALTAGAAATNMLDNLNTARLGLKKIGDGTGWSGEMQKKAAEVLGALGVKNAADKATGYQQFQQSAMTQVNSVLNLAKGPQTDQDARRAQQTFTGLEKTPQANQFLVDYAQAVAERDKRRADFYRQAYPIAQKAGDLTAVDRSWAKVDKSIWTAPSMRRWNKQLKGE